MKDIRKLFRRDRLYWRIMMVVMLGLVFFAMVNGWGRYIKDSIAQADHIQELWDTHPEYHDRIDDPAEGVTIYQPYTEIYGFRLYCLIPFAAFIAQAIKILGQETKNRAEIMRILPVKARSILVYHYISGLLLFMIPTLLELVLGRINVRAVARRENLIFDQPYAVWGYLPKVLVLFLLHYALLLLCRKITSHIPGTVFTFVVLELAATLIFDNLLWNADIYGVLSDKVGEWVILCGVAILLILLGFVAERKKDEARNGFYAFVPVHWMMLGIIFILLCCMIFGAYENLPRVLGVLITGLLSAAITAGVHFIARPKEN